ncbi:kinase-like protein [Panus rudis PR-1116 ss-1]|nr:kinase-like protein [Panus rudis PR-1116 ss-1]
MSTEVTTKAVPSDVCAKLVTVNKKGQKEVLLLSFSRPLIVGRNPELCSYVVSDPVVSNVHCKLYAVRSSTGGVIVSCQDLSSNGLFLNNHWIHGTSIILMDRDTLQIPTSQKFTCFLLNPDYRERYVFNPTPVAKQRLGQWLVTPHSLGSGSFATVRLAMDTSQCAHKQVACKTIKRKKNDARSAITKEVRILSALNHPNINRVYDVVADSTHWHIFLELCTGGDLFSYVAHYEDRDYRLCEGEAKYIMYQLLQGLDYLHARSVAHRVLQPENILLHCPGPYPRIQIADFGLARPKSYEETLNVCGTVPYLPPEGILALDNKYMGYVGIPADCWSSGVIMYLMLSGRHPFDYGVVPGDPDWPTSPDLKTHDRDSQFWLCSAQNDNVVKRRIINGDVDYLPSVWDSMPQAQSLCQWLLSPDSSERATIEDALDSEWIKGDLTELVIAYRKRMAPRT